MPRAALRQAMASDESSPDTGHVEPTGDEPTSESPDVQTPTETASAPEVSDADENEAEAEETVAEEETAAGETAADVKPTGRKRFSLRRSTTTAEPDVDAEGGAVEPVLVPHRTAGRYLKVALIAAAALFVGAAAFAGASVQPYLADRAMADTKFAIAETAANAITTLWTYTPDDMDKLPERSAKYLGGDFANEYRRYIDAIVAPNKQAQISNNTQVMGAAVETLTGDEASAIVYTNSVASTPVTKGAPSLRYISYRLALKRQGADWLITRMSPLTSLDVTPRI
jgi:Mce-associated membrane protein